MGINRRYEDCCSYVTMGVNPATPSSSYPMYGLIFKMNQYYLCECGLSYVLDGAKSVTEHSNIQPFLEEKFEFRKALLRHEGLLQALVWFGREGSVPVQKVY